MLLGKLKPTVTSARKYLIITQRSNLINQTILDEHIVLLVLVYLGVFNLGKCFICFCNIYMQYHSLEIVAGLCQV